jgi:hypothetical protein
MRKRLGRLVPIVMVAVLVQLFAPIAIMRMAAAAASDPLAGMVICSDRGEAHAANSSEQGKAHAHGMCCPLCALAQVASPVTHPPAPYIAIQRSYRRVAWLEAPSIVSAARSSSPPQARAPPSQS